MPRAQGLLSRSDQGLIEMAQLIAMQKLREWPVAMIFECPLFGRDRA